VIQYYEQAVPKLLHALAIALSSADPFVLGAMDGQQFTSPAEPGTVPTIRPEPTANFYVIYGLAFESLVKSMGDSTTSPMAQVALRAMASLVRPQMSGTTVFEGAFFDELCTVAYRIAVSEPAALKAEVTEVLASFITSRKGVMAVDPAQTRRALAVITYTLRSTIPSRENPSVFTYADTQADRVAFLRTAFSAFGRTVECVETVQRADLCAVGLHLFEDLLGDETPGMDLAGQTLPVMKNLLDQALGADVPGTGATGERVVHGLLSQCLSNVDEMR
jgi:hypothetical protein